MAKKIDRVPTFSNQLFLFEKVEDKLMPTKKVYLNKLQKELIIKDGFIKMRPEKKILILHPTKNELIKNKEKYDTYKTVIDVINSEILILGIYKVEAIENEVNNGSN